MRCQHCNREFSDRLNYCPYCGTEAASRSASRDAIRREDKSEGAPRGVRRVSLSLSPELLAPASETAAERPETKKKDDSASKERKVKPVKEPPSKKAADDTQSEKTEEKAAQKPLREAPEEKAVQKPRPEPLEEKEAVSPAGAAEEEEETKRFSQDEMRKIAAYEEAYRKQRPLPEKPEDDYPVEAAYEDDEISAGEDAEERNEQLPEVKVKLSEFGAAFVLAMQKAGHAIQEFLKKSGEKIKEAAAFIAEKAKSGAAKLSAWAGRQKEKREKKRALKQEAQELEAARLAAEAEEAERKEREAEAEDAEYNDAAYRDYGMGLDEDDIDFIPASTYYEYQEQAARREEDRYVDFRDEEARDDYAENPYEESDRAERYADFRAYEPPEERDFSTPRRHPSSYGVSGRRRPAEYQNGEYRGSRDYRSEREYRGKSRDFREEERGRRAASYPREDSYGTREPLYRGAGREEERSEDLRFFTEETPGRSEASSRGEQTKRSAGKSSSKKSRKSTQRRKQNPFRNALEWLMIRLRPSHILILIVIIAIIAGVAIIKNSGSPTREFAEALNERNYEHAAQLYDENYKGKSDLEASSEAEFAAYLNNLKQHALEGKSTYSATNTALDVIKSSALYTGKYKVLVDETAEALVILQQADVLFEAGKDKMNNLDYEGAIQDFNQVLGLYPGFPETADLLATCRDRYREDVIRDVGVLQSQSKYREADELISHALSLIPDDPVLKDLKKNNDTQSVSELYQATRNTAERYFQSGDFAGVFKAIDEALKQDPDDDSIKVLRQEYETKCAENILNTADNIFLQGDREGALEKLKEGLELMPGNDLLKESFDRYNLEGEGPTIPNVTTVDPEETTETTEAEDEPDEEGETISDDLARGSYLDAGGSERKNAVLQSHSFTGDGTVVDQVVFPNSGGAERFKGVLCLGPVDDYTQVYYQVYSSDNQASPLLVGSLYAQSGDDPGSSYKINVDLPVYDADSFIVNLNYLQGGEIDVILDLHFTG